MADMKRSSLKDPVLDVPELAPLGLEAKPDGPAAAAMVSAGIGIFVIGLLTVLSEASVPIHDFLEDLDFGKGVGPLAGKTLLGATAFFLAWGILGSSMKAKEVELPKWFWGSLALGVLGAVMLFPPVFLAFASE